jgi:sulfate adenylyltransferase
MINSKAASNRKTSKGLCIFLTGLSGAGKTTIANALYTYITEEMGRPITVLDGDQVRKNLSSELGFSQKDREINIQRIGYVASEIIKHGGIVICALIAPYNNSRQNVRNMVNSFGHFVEIYVSTPLDICEKRDPKGLYAKARAGIIDNFTGISSPYEIPCCPELIIETTDITPNEIVRIILSYLKKEGYL